ISCNAGRPRGGPSVVVVVQACGERIRLARMRGYNRTEFKELSDSKRAVDVKVMAHIRRSARPLSSQIPVVSRERIDSCRVAHRVMKLVCNPSGPKTAQVRADRGIQRIAGR